MTVTLSRRGILQTSGSAFALAGLTSKARAATPDAAPLRLVANENPYGPSESAKQAMSAALSEGWMYDFEDMAALTKLIAEREGLKPENVIITEGSGELLKIAGLVYGSHGAEVVSAKPTFTQLQDYAEKNGGHLIYVDLDKEMRHDLTAMEARVTNRTGSSGECWRVHGKAGATPRRGYRQPTLPPVTVPAGKQDINASKQSTSSRRRPRRLDTRCITCE